MLNVNVKKCIIGNVVVNRNHIPTVCLLFDFDIYLNFLQMPLLSSNKIDKDDTNIVTVTKKVGDLRFEDEKEDSFYTKVTCNLPLSFQR